MNNYTVKSELKNKINKGVAAFLALTLFFQYVSPVAVHALTSGPGQPEFSSFEPVGTTDMVDVYTGDFTYNIPLLTVPGPNGGYPINMAYHSGPGMDEEASWCGLGWNINVGAINRQLRGLPDDFNGDDVTHRYSLKPNTTVGLNVNSSVSERYGIPPTAPSGWSSPSWQIYYNSYRGLGYRVSMSGQQVTPHLSAGVGLSFDSQNGIGVEPDFTVSAAFKRLSGAVKIGAGYNSRQGLTDGSFSTKSGYTYVGGMSSGASFGVRMDVPTVTTPMRTNTFPFGAHVNPTNGAGFVGEFGATFPQSISGYYSSSQIANNGTVTSDAYGYLYNANGQSDENLRDFQREPFTYSKKIPNLAPSSFTYDLFSQSAQGSGSQFRPYANNVGILTDRRIENKSYSYPIGIEFGAGTDGVLNYTHFGAGFSLEAGSSQSGSWVDVGNNGDVEFADNVGNDELNYNVYTNPAYRSAPFKVVGEKTGVLNSEDHLEKWGGDEAVKVKLEKLADPNWFKRQYVARNNFVRSEADQSGFQVGIDQRVRSQVRERQATNFEVLTDAQAGTYGFTKNIGYTYASGAYTNNPKAFHGGSRADHISELTSVQPDGMRYTYGLPAYNNVQYDGSYAVSATAGDFNTKSVAMAAVGTTMQPTTAGTYDEFSQQTETGPYVHSWMLTSVVSYDYVDLSNNGPTEDDYGYWVRFNYNQTADHYNWHVPYAGANYYEGNKSDPNDDRGSYSCGNREEYFLQSVETKTHIAIFYTSRRQDGVMADDGLNGGMPDVAALLLPSSYLYKLDSIKLYTKAEYYTDIENRILRSGAVAVKTVHFRYSYDLCGNVPNNFSASVDAYGNSPASVGPNINTNEGKLTLEEVFFTYQTSERGAFSPYLFDYGTGGPGSDDNPDYDPAACDRWGQYKNIGDFSGTSNQYPYVDNPWTDQDNGRAGAGNQQQPEAGTWCLKKITLPSGSVIDVSYAPDDYAYVEDQKAMRMFDIYDVGRYPFATGSDARQASTVRTASVENLTELADGQYRVYFKLEYPVEVADFSGPGEKSDFIKEKYLNNGAVEKIYFRAFMDLMNSGLPQHKDYVRGYATIEYDNEAGGSTPPFGLESTSAAALLGIYDLGYILLEGQELAPPLLQNPAAPLVSPFARAALDHLHFNRSEIVYPSVPASTTIPGQITNLLATAVPNAAALALSMVSFNGWAYTKGYGRTMDLNGRSVIRLMEPDGFKYGGGSRVSRITVNDNWDNDPTNSVLGVDPDNYTYGVDYDYTIEEDGEVISSGVCYEPHIGKEESALTQPIEYANSTLLQSSQNLFLETPLLESYYPAAQVGYRKVTAKSIAPQQAKSDDISNSLVHSAAPITIYEFYTPKEFPVIFDQTDINADPAIIRPVIIPGIFTSFNKRKARSQGYSIVLNDMPGKLRSITQRTRPVNNTDPGTLIAKTEYVFFTEEPFSDNKKNKLSSKVQVLLNDNTYQTASVGQSHDIFIDMNENLETSVGGGIDANLDMAVASSPPPTPFYFVPTFFPTINKKELSMRTVVVNKIINRTGIVKEVIATHEASTIKTENIAFDIETGQPLVTRTYNEHKDPVYGYTYPGHWYYDAMQGGYKNQGMVIDCFTGNNFITPSGTIAVTTDGRIQNIDDFLDGLTTHECFEPGDEVWIDFATGATDNYAHIIKVGSDYIDLVYRTGVFLTNGATINSITIVKSGHDNMQSVAVGSLVSQECTIKQIDLQDLAGTQFTINESYSLNRFLSASAIEFMDIMTVDCEDGCGRPDNFEVGVIVDPYAYGIRGIWRPLRSYAYNTTRDQVDDIRLDGVFATFDPFPWANPSLIDPEWITAATVTKYSPYGFELENRDANGIYSSALYEFNKTLNTAVASNAQYKEIAFESFEDVLNPSQCEENSDHWGFMDQAQTAYVSSTRAHSGKQSLYLADGQTLSITSEITDSDCEQSNIDSRLFVPDDDPNTEYQLDDCDCNGLFSPNDDKKYLLMAWVKQEDLINPTINTVSEFQSPNISVSAFDGVSTTSLVTSQVADGPVIDGWQRVYIVFTIPAGTESITVTFGNSNTVASNDYFDDIRIQPFDANMVTYVYDPMTYRLVAQLDANNFAMFYIYDEQGGLEKMKVETKDGIKTVKEGRMNMDKH